MTERVALVTGATRGQGWALAERLRADGFLVAARGPAFGRIGQPSELDAQARTFWGMIRRFQAADFAVEPA